MKSFLEAWIITLLIKVILAALLPMSADEAYYWMWSHHLQLSYLDHPPFIAWLFYLGHGLENYWNLVRLPTVLLGHATMAVWYVILRDRFTWPQFRGWYWLTMLAPLVGFGSMIGTPDVPLLFFWSTSILFFQRALRNRFSLDYFLLGASLGLGFCSKYHIVLFVPIALTYLIVEKRWREIQVSKILLTVLGGFLFCLPVILWNYQNDFASFKYQLDHGLGNPVWESEWTIGYILGELMLIFPVVLWAAITAKPSNEYKYLKYFAWGPLLFFLFSSFRGAVELNWPNAAFPAVFALVLFSPLADKAIRWAKIFWISLYVVAFTSVSFLPVGHPIAKPFREPSRFNFLTSLQSRYTPLYAGTYQIASAIWYANKKPIFKLRSMSRPDYYDTFPESLPQEDSFYVIQENWSEMPDWIKKSGYKREVVEEIAPHYIVVKVSK